ncbi:MAG: guanylate kinase [Gammaproteobacteria bacterium]
MPDTLFCRRRDTLINSRGRLFVLSAPSGAGKTTLVRRVMSRRPNLTFSVSYTTRPRRSGETDGRDYHFLTPDEFAAMRDGGEFLEHAEVFDHCYGTGREQVDKLRDAGNDVLLEIDWQGARQVRGNQPDCCSVFILPPSVEELERRLRGRETDSAEVIARRLGDAVDDMSHWTEFDHVVINDDLEGATEALLSVMAGDAPGSATGNAELRARVAALLRS